MESVADGVLCLMPLELFVELFPDVHAFLLSALEEVIHGFHCLMT